MVDLAFSVHSTKLLKVSDGEGENEKSVMVDLLTSDEGILPELASLVKDRRILYGEPKIF